MRALSREEIPCVLRRVRTLQHSNRRLAIDLRDARFLLMEAMVRRDPLSDTLPLRRDFSRRAAQYALLLVRELERGCELKGRYYLCLVGSSRSLHGGAVQRISRRLREQIPGYDDEKPRVDGMVEQPLVAGSEGLLERILEPLRSLGLRWRESLAPVGRRLQEARWTRELEFFVPRSQLLMERALEVGQAFSDLTVPGNSDRELERARESIIREAGSRYDPLMVEALVGSWSLVLRFFRLVHVA